ncbi:MAG TPA: hypothetical protein VHL59_12770 [Thermoanaerobaculia bacterium]|nr:hypothetical protein [Thermoanaerobaculia bacterium]
MRLAVIALALLAAADGLAESVRYTIRCSADERVLYEATVEGPAATDFDVVLRDPQFELQAFFVNEGAGPVDMRVRLETRRRAGSSRAGLPLWEHDEQQHRFRVTLDQQIELLPFGAPGPRGLLKLTIVPQRTAARADAPRIDIRRATGDAIAVHAYRVPHWYDVTARVDGTAVATARIFAREPTRLSLGALGELVVTAGAAPFRDAWQATLVRFDGRWKNGVSFASGWEGVGGPLRYSIKGPRGEAWTLILDVTPKERP